MLGQLIDIGWPTLKALTCLEANEATPGDICVYWHALLYEINSILHDPESTIPNDAMQEIYSILNLCHNELFGDGHISSAAELYYVGAYLDPSRFENLLLPLLTRYQLSCAPMIFLSILKYPAQLVSTLTTQGYNTRLFSGWLLYSYQMLQSKRFRRGINQC